MKAILLLSILLMVGCSTTTIKCAGESNVCLVTRPGYTPEVIYMKACDYPGGTCYE